MERLALARPGRITISLTHRRDAQPRARPARVLGEDPAEPHPAQEAAAEQNLAYASGSRPSSCRTISTTSRTSRGSRRQRMEVFYQPIEQNYNTKEDSRWWERTGNWPQDPARAVAAVEELIRLKREGLPIVNSVTQLEVMLPYFRNPDAMRLAVQSHTAHERSRSVPRWVCCTPGQRRRHHLHRRPAVGNIKTTPIREIWKSARATGTGLLSGETALGSREDHVLAFRVMRKNAPRSSPCSASIPPGSAGWRPSRVSCRDRSERPGG